jgi:hypothetical protein
LKFLAAKKANYGWTSKNIPQAMKPIPKIGRTMAANKQGQKLRWYKIGFLFRSIARMRDVSLAPSAITPVFNARRTFWICKTPTNIKKGPTQKMTSRFSITIFSKPIIITIETKFQTESLPENTSD